MAAAKSIVIAGKTYPSIAKAAQQLGISAFVAKDRASRGWSPEKAHEVRPRISTKNRPITVAGVSNPSVAEAARAHGIEIALVWQRLMRGMPIDRALEVEGSGFKSRGVAVTFNGVTYATLRSAARAYGISEDLFVQRYRTQKWTIEQALGLEMPPYSDEKVFGRIYQICHIATGKRYIGLTRSSLKKRWDRHVTTAQSRPQWNSDSLQAAILLYGEQAFAITEVAVGHTVAELANLERKYIKLFQTAAPQGFNLGKGGEGVNTFGIRTTVRGVTYTSIADACRALGTSPGWVKNRLKAGWSMDDAFSKRPLPRQSNIIMFREKKYSSEIALAEAFGVGKKQYVYRKESGYTLEQRLGLEPLPEPKTTVTVNGEKYPSLTSAAKAHGLNYAAVLGRIRAGWSIERAFAEPLGQTKHSVIFEGIAYASVTDLAQAFNLSTRVLRKRIKANWSLEKAVRTPARIKKKPSVFVFQGITYASLSALAAAFQVPAATVQRRLNSGWALERALRTSVEPPTKAMTFEGATYSSQGELAHAFGISRSVLVSRLHAGWSLERALKTPVGKQQATAPATPATQPTPAALPVTDINSRQRPFAFDAANSGEVAEAA